MLHLTLYSLTMSFFITLTKYECSCSQAIIAEFQQRIIAQTGKRKALDEDDLEDEQMEEEDYHTPRATRENSESSTLTPQFSLTDQTHDVVLQMLSKPAMMAEYNALQQQNSALEDHTTTTPSSAIASTITLLNQHHILKNKTMGQFHGDWSDSSVSTTLTSIRMAAQLIPDLLKSAAIMASLHTTLSFEACVVTRQIYWWYTHTGPELVSELFWCYHHGKRLKFLRHIHHWQSLLMP